MGTDNHQSIGLITDYLCRTGERPTFFDMPAVNHNAAERRAAYVAAMERQGLQPEIVPVPARRVWSFEEVGYTTALAMIDGRAGFPTRTLLCANDRIAVGVMAAAFERGIRVGRDPDCGLRVAGHDDQPLSRYTCPPLTTVAQDFERLAETALDILSGPHRRRGPRRSRGRPGGRPGRRPGQARGAAGDARFGMRRRVAPAGAVW